MKNPMNESAKYKVLSYDAFSVEKCGGEVRWIEGYSGEREADNLKEAKRLARYLLSEEYRMSAEMSERHVYASVHLGGEDGECVHDEWRKDYVAPVVAEGGAL